MRAWRRLRAAFLLASLFVILLIIIYWDDVGGFSLYPFQELKHKFVQSGCCTDITTGSPLSVPTDRTRTRAPITVYTTASASTLISKGAAQKITDAEQKTKESEYEEVKTADDSEQKVRKQRIMDVCLGKGAVDFPGRTRAFEQIPIRELDHLIVDDTHQIIYCYVPKVQLLCGCIHVIMLLIVYTSTTSTTVLLFTNRLNWAKVLRHSSVLSFS